MDFNADGMGAIIGLFIALICAGMFFYLVYEFFRRRRIKGSGWSATGTITRTWTTTHTHHNANGGMHTITNHHAEAAYRTHWNEQRTVRLDGHFRQGDEVNVRYDQTDGYVPLMGRKSSANSGCGGCLAVLLFLALVIVVVSVLFPDVSKMLSDTINDILSSVNVNS
ncbi:hypothetical protein Cs7R123_64660 [Catellatospora sp. TT07R-123]|uniref:DUF3592 domain-containing protein n=1 Tax=Catellatospora sp. TT07R-123 TaxID=2733863 RepID=UPI001B06C0E7|nr:DUF3592 domain-containing protein [Catellatospora sp. TT07R-123]GHJ49124.1 hypothetical protein Cs7R123_64660 [Catellatospora sp. TT07R-123]